MLIWCYNKYWIFILDKLSADKMSKMDFKSALSSLKRLDNVVVRNMELNYQKWRLYDCGYHENEVSIEIHELRNDSYKCKIFLSDDRILSVPFRKHVICTVGKC